MEATSPFNLGGKKKGDLDAAKMPCRVQLQARSAIDEDNGVALAVMHTEVRLFVRKGTGTKTDSYGHELCRDRQDRRCHGQDQHSAGHQLLETCEVLAVERSIAHGAVGERHRITLVRYRVALHVGEFDLAPGAFNGRRVEHRRRSDGGFVVELGSADFTLTRVEVAQICATTLIECALAHTAVGELDPRATTGLGVAFHVGEHDLDPRAVRARGGERKRIERVGVERVAGRRYDTCVTPPLRTKKTEIECFGHDRTIAAPDVQHRAETRPQRASTVFEGAYREGARSTMKMCVECTQRVDRRQGRVKGGVFTPQHKSEVVTFLQKLPARALRHARSRTGGPSVSMGTHIPDYEDSSKGFVGSTTGCAGSCERRGRVGASGVGCGVGGGVATGGVGGWATGCGGCVGDGAVASCGVRRGVRAGVVGSRGAAGCCGCAMVSGVSRG